MQELILGLFLIVSRLILKILNNEFLQRKANWCNSRYTPQFSLNKTLVNCRSTNFSTFFEYHSTRAIVDIEKKFSTWKCFLVLGEKFLKFLFFLSLSLLYLKTVFIIILTRHESRR